MPGIFKASTVLSFWSQERSEQLTTPKLSTDEFLRLHNSIEYWFQVMIYCFVTYRSEYGNFVLVIHPKISRYLIYSYNLLGLLFID